MTARRGRVRKGAEESAAAMLRSNGRARPAAGGVRTPEPLAGPSGDAIEAPPRVVIADDDPEDRMLAEDALHEARLSNEIHFVEDGEDLMNYLKRRGRYTNPADSPRPGMILLDLNMPRMDGREALAAIKADDDLRMIPVIILTTSDADEDILRVYNLGAASFITKPVTFEGLVKVMLALKMYWFEIVALPGDRN